MNYTKPEVAVLGEAIRVIENRVSKPSTAIIEAIGVPKMNPAYDFDE